MPAPPTPERFIRFILGGLLVLACAHAGFAGEVRVIDQVWTDPARKREVPVRIHMPPGPGPFPVILFSHGLGGSRAGGARWGRVWAENGFISIHLQHAGSDETLWKDKRPLAGLDSLRRAMTVDNGRLRAGDVSFAIDRVLALRSAGDPLLAPADATRIGMSGHSFGARTTITVVSQPRDARIRAAIVFSPAGEASEALNRERSGRIEAPFMSVTGTEDRVPLLLGEAEGGPQARRVPYGFMPAPDKYLLVLNGADHMFFNGEPEGRKWSDANREVHAPLVERATVAFWKAYLGDDAGARAELTAGAIAAAVGVNGEWSAK